MKQKLHPHQGLCPQNLSNMWQNKSDNCGQRVRGDGKWDKENRKWTTKKLQKWRLLLKIQVPAMHLLRDQRASRLLPAWWGGGGGGVWGQWAFCWGLKWVIKVKGWQWRRGRNTASGRELLIRGETQTLQIHLHSGRSQSQGATKLRVHNLYPQSKSYLFFPAPESSVGKAGPEPRCHPGDLCFSAWSQGTCREFLGFSQPKFLSFSTTSHYSYASRPSSPPFHSAL